MKLGYFGVERMSGGISGWTLAGHYSEVGDIGNVTWLITGGAKVVDARDLASYDAGHIPGARHVPAADLVADPEGGLLGIAKSADVVLYGSGGPDGELARAAAAAEQAGFAWIHLYRGGFADWAQGGGEVE